MEVRAVVKMRRVPPKKARIVADQVKGMRALRAMNLLHFLPNKTAAILEKLIKSATANAKENHQLNEEDLIVKNVLVDGGPVLKRIRARAMGRANRILKRTSHITVIVEDVPEVPKQTRQASTKPTAKAVAAPAEPKKRTRKTAVEAVRPAPEVPEATPEMLKTEPEVVEPVAAAEPEATEPTPPAEEAGAEKQE
jgi:large subunit ribosomal protein L22